jgi:hypothetical protein
MEERQVMVDFKEESHDLASNSYFLSPILCTRVYIASRLYSLVQPGSGHA